MQPTNGRQTENENAQIKKWCKFTRGINPLNAELNPICHFLALLGAHHIFHISRIRVKAKSRKTRAYIVRVIKSRKIGRAMYKYEDLTKARETVDLLPKPVEFRTSGRHRRRGGIILKGNLKEQGVKMWT